MIFPSGRAGLHCEPLPHSLQRKTGTPSDVLLSQCPSAARQSNLPPRPATPEHPAPSTGNDPHTATKARLLLRGPEATGRQKALTLNSKELLRDWSSHLGASSKLAADGWLCPLPRESHAHLNAASSARLAGPAGAAYRLLFPITWEYRLRGAGKLLHNRRDRSLCALEMWWEPRGSSGICL